MLRNSGIILFLLVFFGIVDICLLGFSAELTKSDWAAWVQAIGSIVAIAVAWLGIRHQIEIDARARAMDSHAIRQGMAALCLAAADDVIDAFNYLVLKLNDADRETRFEEISIDRFETLAQTIATLAQKELIPQLFSELIVLQREIAYTVTAVRQYNREKTWPSCNRIKHAKHRENLVRDARKVIDAIGEAYATHRGSEVLMPCSKSRERDTFHQGTNGGNADE